MAQSQMQFKKLLYIPFLSIAAAFIIYTSFMSSGPIFEGYDFIDFFRTHSFFSAFPWSAGRPLTPLVWFLAAKTGGIGKTGFFLIYIFHESIKLFAIFRLRAHLKFFTVPLVLLSIALPGWNIFTNERYSAAQFALSFSILGISFYLTSRKYLSIFFMLCAVFTYPPSVVFASLGILCANVVSHNGLHMSKSKWSKTKYIFVVPIFYFLTADVFLKLFKVSSYDTSSSRPGFHHIWSYIREITGTLVWRTPGDCVLILCVLIATLLVTNNFKQTLIQIGLVLIYIFMAEFVYAVSNYYIRDRERIFYIAAGVVFIFLYVRIYSNSTNNFSTSRYTSSLQFRSKLWCYCAISLSLISIYCSFTYYKFITTVNASVISDINSVTNKAKIRSSVVLIDDTGRFGDVNSLYGSSSLENILTQGNSLLSALNFLNPNIDNADICTKSGIIAFSPIAERFPLPAVQNCSGLNLSNYSYVFEVKNYIENPTITQLRKPIL